MVYEIRFNSKSNSCYRLKESVWMLPSASRSCPGRFLAVHETKLIVAYLLTNYDIEYTKAKPQVTNLLAMKVPKMDALIRVRKRAA